MRRKKILIFINIVLLLIILVQGTYIFYSNKKADDVTKDYNENNQKNDESNTNIEDNFVKFEDENLKNAISEILGVESITKEEALQVTTLILDDKNIQTINGIEFFENLKELSMDYNYIIDISSLSKLTNLTYLSLASNNIKDVSALSNLENLENLYLFSNEITDIKPLLRLNKLHGLPTLYNNNILNYELFESKLELYRANAMNDFYTVSFENNVAVYERDFSHTSLSYCDDDYVTCITNDYYNWNKNEIETYKLAMKEARDFVSKNITYNMSDLEKEITISEYLVKKMYYKSTDGTYDGTHDLYYPLVLGYGQCHNYAQAFNLLAMLSGLESYSAFAGAAHEWNLVKIDGVFYHLDLTWADTGDALNYEYVNKSTLTMDNNHGSSLSFTYPLNITISKEDMEFKGE